MKVSEFMKKNYCSIQPTNSIKELLSIFSKENANSLPVTNDRGKLIGVVTEGDIFRLLTVHIPKDSIEFDKFFKAFDESYISNRLKKVVDFTVADIMFKDNIVSITPEHDLEETIALFSKVRFKELPVIDSEGFLLGIVSRSNVVQYILTKKL